MVTNICYLFACLLNTLVTGDPVGTPSQQSPSATIDQGTVVGTTTALPDASVLVDQFLGIPFAVSPPERFSPPREPSRFKRPFKADAFKPSCIQQFSYPEASRKQSIGLYNSPPPPAGESEDCLYINIFSPSFPAPAVGRPVMFWIYGGSLQMGTGGRNLYDGTAFAAYQDVVLVTFNYRTNVFGFSASPQLPEAERNVGFLDQRMALNWVQNNIAAFGGDPKRVTIFGESAGGSSVDTLLTTFTTEAAPFHAAIIESSEVSYLAAQPFAANSTESWEALGKELHCSPHDVLSCARAAPASRIKSIQETQMLTFRPTIDNVTYPICPACRRQSGDFAAVPILVGSNANEGTLFEIGETNVDSVLQDMFGTTAPESIPDIRAAFPDRNGFDVTSDIATLSGFQCGIALMANETVAKDVPAWRYYYNSTFSNLSPYENEFGVYHSSEIPLVFQTYPGGPVNPVTRRPEGLLPHNKPPTDAQVALGRRMNGAWAAFARDPHHGPGWDQVGSLDGRDLHILGGPRESDGSMIQSSTFDRKCEVFFPAFRALSGDVYGLKRG